MIRELLQDTLAQGYNILYNGNPIKVQGDLLEYVELHKSQEFGVFIISELLKLTDEELNNIILK